MKSQVYVVHGNPLALARARCSRGKVYDSQKHNKLLWGLDLSRQFAGTELFKGPLGMDVIFYFPIPTTYSTLKKENTKSQWHIFRPDCDNLIKFVSDVATSICYEDDCIISKITSEKVYDDGKGPRTEFVLYSLDKRTHREL